MTERQADDRIITVITDEQRDRRAALPQGAGAVAVHGCGGVGLSAIMIASAMGNVVAIDLTPEKLFIAREIGAV